MAEITLSDLLAWEPRLRPSPGIDGLAAGGGGSARSGPTAAVGPDAEREVTWAVTARATTPMLPPLRGGELVLLPRRMLTEAGVALPMLMRELAGHRVAAVVLEAAPPSGTGGGPPVLLASPTTPELESDVNRLLTERRGELYRAGTELERVLADLTTAGADLGRVVATAATALGLPVAVLDARGAPLAASGPDAVPPATIQSQGAAGWRGLPRADRLTVELAPGGTLWLGPVPPARRALARLVGQRVAVAAEAALARVAQAAPRGAARAAALRALLSAPPAETADAGARGAGLGLPAGATYRVALAPGEMAPTTLQRVLGSLGMVHEAGVRDGQAAAVIEGRPDPPSLGERARRAGAAADHAAPSARAAPPGPSSTWLAISGPTTGPGGLPGAGREARYVAALLAAGLVPGPVARFEVLNDLGPFRLLYPLWGTPALDAFAAEALADLADPKRDRRGTLRGTLLAYLDTGGSHVEAATALGIHRNTLSYRLKQIATLTGRDPTDSGSRLVLHLALLASALPPDRATAVSTNGSGP